MAKSRNIFGIRGTFGDVTIVDSKAYGEHTRRARGTVKKAEVNSTFKEHNTLMTKANNPARVIKNAIDPYRADFQGGMLWQELVGFFKKQLKAGSPFNLALLTGTQINKNYKTSRLCTLEFINIQPEIANDELMLSLPALTPKNHQRKTDAFCAELILITVDFNTMSAETVSAKSGIIANKDTSPIIFRFPMPVDPSESLLCLKISGYNKEAELEGESAKGMAFIGTIKLQEGNVEFINPYLKDENYRR